MIAANYLSAWVGTFTLGPMTRLLHEEVFRGLPLFTSHYVLLTILALAYGSFVASSRPVRRCSSLIGCGHSRG